jgi:hypothetical protein
MRLPHKFAHHLALITVSLTLPFLVPDVRAQVPCATPPAHGQLTTWKQDTTVNVMIDPTFTSQQQQAIKDQLNKWKNSGNANITFKVVEPSQAGGGATSGGPPILSIMRQEPQTDPTAQGETRGFSFNGNRGDTFMEINPGVTDPAAFIHVASHEIGHTFGLGDCGTCPAGSSAMTLPQSLNLNAAGGHDGPTNCDSNKVATNGNYTPPPSPTPTPTPELGVEGYPGGVMDCGIDLPPTCWNGHDDDGDLDIDTNDEDCICPSPVLVDLAGNGFDLTLRAEGVQFDLNRDGVKEQLPWTAINSDDAWLALDRNGNGTIDNGEELFGSYSPQEDAPLGIERNGFRALAEYDKPATGGNGDGEINQNDAIFSSLRLWQDKNHNGVSEWWELHTLSDFNVESISLDFRESKLTDQHGNQFRYRAKIRDSKGVQVGRWAWDVFFVTP